MNATIELLQRQHRDVLSHLDALESGPGDAEALRQFLGYLRMEVTQHFALEERAVFPLLARHLGMVQGPLAVMNAEHARFRELMTDLEDGVHAADLGRQRSTAHELADLLRGHIAKEDNVLFPLASRLLSPDEQAEMDAMAGTAGSAGFAGEG